MILKIIKLGWKNVWRNPTRSGVVIIAVLLGTWAGVFLSAFFNGMTQDYLKNEFELSVGHLQITHPKFDDLFQPEYAIQHPDSVIQLIREQSFIQKVQAQSLVTGLAQSPKSSYGVSINGVVPEDKMSPAVKNYVTQGNFLDGEFRNPVVVGTLLADRLDLDLRSKVVLSFQDIEGNITAGAFRVAGIFDTHSDKLDQNSVYVAQEDITRLLGQKGIIHKITVYVDEFGNADLYKQTLGNILPDLQIKTWGELSPALRYVFSSMDISLYVVMVIIIIALIFSIVNTMLMAILERTRELGMLRAIGMNRTRTFFMILSETFFLTMAGVPAGLLFSWITVSILGTTGIDLSAFAQGFNAYGLSSVIHPELTPDYYLNVALLIAAAALLSALYPAWKTLKLKPVEAIRKI